MSGGYITNGWPWVWAAYGVTAFLLTTYAVSLFVRLKKDRPE